jgi:hypothetical protein
MATDLKSEKFRMNEMDMGVRSLPDNQEKAEFRSNVQMDSNGGITSRQSNVAATLLGARYNTGNPIDVGSAFNVSHSLRDPQAQM